MSAFNKYTVENMINTNHTNNFSSETILLKHRRTFIDEFYLSEVYNFCKKDIKFFTNFYKKFATFSNYTLYVYYEQEKQNVFHISMDDHGAILNKQKYFLYDDISIVYTFNIYISIEQYKLPLNIYPKNTLELCLSPTFELCNEERRVSGSVQIKTIKFKSKTIETGIYSTEEIYNKTLQHIINLQCLYKQDRIDDLIATKTAYTLELNSNENSFVLYHVEINAEGEKLHESKPYRMFPTASYPFKLFIFINIHHDPAEVSRQRWLEEQAEDAVNVLEVRLQNLRNEIEAVRNATDLKTNTKCTKEETCCICLSSPSRVLFPDCGHLCICENCNNNLTNNHDFDEEDFKCPMCRTKVSLPRIII